MKKMNRRLSNNFKRKQMHIWVLFSFVCCISLFLSSVTISYYWSQGSAALDLSLHEYESSDSSVYPISPNSRSESLKVIEKSNAQRKHIQRKRMGLPGIAWLMSFPNSGTSFTMHLVGKVSKSTVATNYGKEYQLEFHEHVEPIPLSNKSPNGPFLLSPKKTLPPVDSFILTKTHCGGYCTNCSPNMYIETKHSFKSKCAQGSMVDANETKILLQYDFNNVEKAIHLVRDPFNNIVSNFHLDRNKKVKGDNTAWLLKFPNNASGFKQWCRSIDTMHYEEEIDSNFLPNFITTLYRDVPCHTLFYLFAEWHNLARQVTLDLTLPTLIIHYEEYEHNFESTLSNIMEFLNLPRAQEPIEFISGKVYDDYFTLDERLAAKQLVQAISDEWTWSVVSRYFP